VTSTRLGSITRPLLGGFVLLAAFGLWEVAASLDDSFGFPQASEVLERAWQIWPTSEFLASVAASLQRLAAGFAIGALVGVGTGLLMGSSRFARQLLEPLVELLRAIPPIALVPAAIVVLGLGGAMQVSVIAFGVCFPVLVNTMEGVRAIPPEARDTASMLHVGTAERVFRVYLPAALPSIVAGLRIALSIGLVLVVISEFTGEGEGLGRFIIGQQTLIRVPEMYAGILFLGLLGFVLNGLFLLAERRLLAWHYGAAGDPVR
jgi:ABC-type nitrate/sulfonate/bicarbonate transport system permease component